MTLGPRHGQRAPRLGVGRGANPPAKNQAGPPQFAAALRRFAPQGARTLHKR